MDIFNSKILSFLRTGIEKTMRSYDRHTNAEIEDENHPDFAKHHTACKQAVTHLELLLKIYEKNLALQKDEGDKKSTKGKNMHSLIEEACIRIKEDNDKL